MIEVVEGRGKVGEPTRIRTADRWSLSNRAVQVALLSRELMRAVSSPHAYLARPLPIHWRIQRPQLLLPLSLVLSLVLRVELLRHAPLVLIQFA